MELVGRVEKVDDAGGMPALGVSVYERHYGEYREDFRGVIDGRLHKRVAVELVADRTVSCDRRKLSSPAG